MDETTEAIQLQDLQRVANVKILVVDDDPVLLRMVKTFLESAPAEFSVLTADSGEKALQVARSEVPDLILLDLMMPGMDGIEVCERLRTSRLTYLIPVIMLTASASQVHRLDALRTGVDDYISKPFDPEELEARIEGLIRRIRLSRASNPLTGLPGNLTIEQEITRRIQRGEMLACCYIDIDNFKAFNDKYSFEKGDECIKLVSDLLIQTAEEIGQPEDFIGHIGGDDFIYMTSPERVDTVCPFIIEKFDKHAPGLYNEEDLERGYIEVENRQQQTQRFPIMTLSIGVTTNERRLLTSALQVAEIAAELKHAAKRAVGKSNYIIDRRSN
ncbi:MAG: response regulator [Armatimonadetes bacterium]|nr:response regulator [Armatimonadota bacterium]